MASLLCCSSFIKKLPVNQGGALSPSCFSLSEGKGFLQISRGGRRVQKGGEDCHGGHR
ncbi:unnamed protein product, partial [Vitis vinifera]